MRVVQVISGGQTGADQGALFGARDCNIATGGVAPQGWRTDVGPAPWLASFGLYEHTNSRYDSRTAENVRISDGTLWFGRPIEASAGGLCTQRAAKLYGKPLIPVQWPAPDADWGRIAIETAAKLDFRVLNIAGNRERLNPGITGACRGFIQLLNMSRRT